MLQSKKRYTEVDNMENNLQQQFNRQPCKKMRITGKN